MSNQTPGCNVSTTLFKRSDKKLLALKKCVLGEIRSRHRNLYYVKGTEGGRPSWCLVIVDPEKEEQFLEASRSSNADILVYGDYLFCGFGEEVPDDVREKQNLIHTFQRDFHLIIQRRGPFEYCNYVLIDTTLPDFNIAEPIATQIETCSKVLHSGWGRDVPEAVTNSILKASYHSSEFVSFGEESMQDIFAAARNGEIDEIKKFVSHGNRYRMTDEKNWSVLHHAAFGGSLEVTDFLIEKKVEINKEDGCGRKPIHIAAREGHLPVVDLFLTKKVDINSVDKKGWTVLHYACWNGNVELVKFLINGNAKIKARDFLCGKMPFHVAAREGHIEVLKFFLDMGMDIEEKDSEKRTPLYYTMYQGHFEAFEHLLSKGADINVKNKSGVNMGHMAAAADCVEALSLLLKKGFDTKLLDEGGSNVLHYASMFNSLECTEHLLKVGTDPFEVDKDNKTPFDVAKKNYCVETEFLLTLQAGINGYSNKHHS